MESETLPVDSSELPGEVEPSVGENVDQRPVMSPPEAKLLDDLIKGIVSNTITSVYRVFLKVIRGYLDIVVTNTITRAGML